jgi:hypothetical protein
MALPYLYIAQSDVVPVFNPAGTGLPVVPRVILMGFYVRYLKDAPSGVTGYRHWVMYIVKYYPYLESLFIVY